MIFATVGTHHQPFPRFVAALAPVAARTRLQFGHTPPPAGMAEASAFLPFPEILAAMDAAEAVVTHAGVGSLLCARDAGHVPIVVPRLRRLGEHVDDHQVELARALEPTGQVLVLWEDGDLPSLLERLPPRRARREGSARELAAAVRTTLRPAR